MHPFSSKWLFLVEWISFRVAGAGWYRTYLVVWSRIVAVRETFSLLAFPICVAKSIVLGMRTTLVLMMLMRRDFFYDVGAFVLGASGQVDLGVLFVTLSVRSCSSSSSFCKIV